MKVLILDDEPPARRGMKQVLAQIGVTDVRDVGTIEQAVKALNEERPDVLLLDVELRGGKVGFDLLDTLPAEGIPAIFITAHPDHALRAFESSLCSNAGYSGLSLSKEAGPGSMWEEGKYLGPR